MWWCEKCNCEVEGKTFQEVELHSEVDTRCYEIYDNVVCEYCGGDVVEADKCACGESKSSLDYYCPDCMSDAEYFFNQFKTRRKLDKNKAVDCMSLALERIENND